MQSLVQCATSSEESSEEESSSDEALPPGWEKRESRTKKGVYYYAHVAKGLSQMERPKGEATQAEVQPQDFKEVSGPVIFSLLLDRCSGARLGVDIETGRESAGWDGRTLLIRGIQEDGLVKAWNDSYPVKAVLPGDRICAVNGFSGDAKVLITECCKKQVLELTLTRDLGSSVAHEESPAPKASDVSAAQPTTDRRPPRPSLANHERARKLKQDVADAASAAAVVKLLRSELQHSWAASWGAEALLKIADRSTDQTREAWSKDSVVVELADSLMRESSMSGTMTPVAEELELVLMTLEALRRMHLQNLDKQRAPLLRCIERAAAERWECPVKVLARILWLAAPFKMKSLAPAEDRLRQHYLGLDAVSFFHIVDGLRCRQRHVLQEFSSRLKSERMLADALPTLHDFRISFDLVPHATSENPTSVLRLADAGQDVLFSRNCLPTVCLKPKSTELLVFLGPQGKPFATYESPPPGLPIGQLSRVLVTLSKEVFMVYVNGKEVALTNVPGVTSQPTDAKTQVWAGDTIYEAASASIGNLVLFHGDGCHGSDNKLLHKAALRLQEEKFCASIPTPHLVPVIETLDELGIRNKRALQSLGQEVLQRKPEFSPDDMRRIQIAFDQCKLPLNTVWAALGVSKKRKGGQLVTSQVFAPQQGHDKKHRSEQDIERTSPERYVADHVQSSY